MNGTSRRGPEGGPWASAESPGADARRITSRAATLGVAKLAGAAVLVRVVGAVGFAVIARAVGPEQLGLVAVAATFALALEAWVGQGFSDFVVSVRELERAHLDTAFWLNTAAGGCFAGVLILAAGAIERVVETPGVSDFLRWLSLGLVFHGASIVPAALLLRDGRFGVVATRSAFSAVLAAGVGVAAALRGAGGWSMVAQALASDAGNLAMLFATSGYVPGGGVSRRHARELWAYGRNMMGSAIIGAVGQRLGVALVGAWNGALGAGHFAVGQRIQQIATQLLIKPVDTVALPAFARIGTADGLAAAFPRVLSCAAAIAWPAFAGLAALSVQAVGVVLGPQWDPAAAVVAAFCLLGAAQVPAYLAGAALRSIGRPDLVLRARGLEVGLGLIALVAARGRGVPVMALAYAAATVLVLPYYLRHLRREAGVSLLDCLAPMFRVSATVSVLVGTVQVALALVGRQPEIVKLVACSSAGAAAYLLAGAVLLRPELHALRAAIRRRSRGPAAVDSSAAHRR